MRIFKKVKKSPTLGKWDIRTLPDIVLETGVDLCVAKFAKPFEISQQIEFASCQSPSIVLLCSECEFSIVCEKSNKMFKAIKNAQILSNIQSTHRHLRCNIVSTVPHNTWDTNECLSEMGSNRPCLHGPGLGMVK